MDQLDDINPKRRISVSSAAEYLSVRVFLLTACFVLIAEIVLFVPSIANFRMKWLQERLSVAQIASSVFIADGELSANQELQDEILAATSAHAIYIINGDQRRLIAAAQMPSEVHVSVDLREWHPATAIWNAFEVLFSAESGTLLLKGDLKGRRSELEVLVSEEPLHAAMVEYAINIAWLSAIISFITGALVYFSLRWLIIKPVLRISQNMTDFAEAPQDVRRILPVSERKDEIGVAERHLAAMQSQLHDTLRQQKRLADLGLAVSKINHDLRNILSSAQLFSDRLSAVEDPMVKRFGPRIVRALDRAVSYTQSVLAFGKAQDAAPNIQRVNCAKIVDEVRELLAVPEGIEFNNLVEPSFKFNADPDQLFRIVHNICRNALQAMSQEAEEGAVHRISVCASINEQSNEVRICVGDNGPGVPARAKQNLFKPFKGSVTSGGTGLGLAIAAELVGFHGGTLCLLEEPDCSGLDEGHTGAIFEIRLPQHKPRKEVE